MNEQKVRTGILTGGTWCADHNRLIERWPEEDALAQILSEDVRGGGSACNLAIDIKRLDPELPVATIGLVGDDEDGKFLIEQAKAEGLDCSRLAVSAKRRTTFTDAYTSDESARRTHLFHAGVGQLLSPDHFDFGSTDARIFHLGLPGLHETMDGPWQGDPNGWVTVLKRAQTAGLLTNLELCSLPADRLCELVVPCLDQLNYLIVNDFEIAALAGQPRDHAEKTDPEDCIAHAQHILQSSPIELAIVHFPSGAIAVSNQGSVERCPSVNVPESEVVGTNGAGDAFAAGAIYGIHQNWSLPDTLKLGHATAAASIRHIGTTDSVVGWSECLELASQFGWRDELT